MRLLAFLFTDLTGLLNVVRTDLDVEIAIVPANPTEQMLSQVQQASFTLGPVAEKGFWKIEENVSYQQELRQFLQEWSPDVAWSDGIFPSGYGLLLAKELGIPTIASSFGRDVAVVPNVRYGYVYNERKKRLLRNVVQNGIDVYAATPWCVRQFHTYWNREGRIREEELILHLGHSVERIDTQRERMRALYGLSEAHVAYATWCRFVPVKGLEYAIDAFSSLDDPCARYFLVGMQDDEYSAYIQRYVMQKNDPRISVLPWMEHVDLFAFLQGVDVAVVSSFSEQGSYSFLQAVALRLPLVSTAVGYTYGYVRGGMRPYVLVRKGSVESMARAMRQMLRRSAREEYARRTYIFEQLVDRSAVAASWGKLLQSVVRDTLSVT